MKKKGGWGELYRLVSKGKVWGNTECHGDFIGWLAGWLAGLCVCVSAWDSSSLLAFSMTNSINNTHHQPFSPGGAQLYKVSQFILAETPPHGKNVVVVVVVVVDVDS